LPKDVGAIVDINLGAPYDVVHITPSQLEQLCERIRNVALEDAASVSWMHAYNDETAENTSAAILAMKSKQ
jgi:hypothetical protein